MDVNEWCSLAPEGYAAFVFDLHGNQTIVLPKLEEYPQEQIVPIMVIVGVLATGNEDLAELVLQRISIPTAEEKLVELLRKRKEVFLG